MQFNKLNKIKFLTVIGLIGISSAVATLPSKEDVATKINNNSAVKANQVDNYLSGIASNIISENAEIKRANNGNITFEFKSDVKIGEIEIKKGDVTTPITPNEFATFAVNFLTKNGGDTWKIWKNPITTITTFGITSVAGLFVYLGVNYMGDKEGEGDQDDI